MPFGKEAPPYLGPGPGSFGCGGFGHHALALILIVLFFFFVLGCIMMSVRMIRGRGMMMHGMHMHGGFGAGDPLEIAKMRYAKGEISAEEFETIKKNLS